MAITNAQINRLNQLSSILSSVGNAYVDNMQSQSDQRVSNAGSLISTYYTDSNTGRVAETINSSTRESLQENMQKLQSEIGELDVTGAKGKIAGLGDFSDNEVASALKSFKNNAGTYLASSYIQGQSALEQQYKNNAFTAFDNYFKNAYSSYATDAQNLGDITNAEANFGNIFDNATVDTMIENGYVPASYRDDYEKYLEEYKKQYGEKWAMNSILYTKAMQDSQIATDFGNGLGVDFSLDHAPSTFISTTTDEQGKETTTYMISGAESYNNAKALYDSRYESTQMSIADPNGLRKSGTKTGDTAIWTYTADSWLYNYGYYSAVNSEWLSGDMEAQAREWATDFLSQTSLSEDEQKILLEQWIGSNFDSSGNPTDGGEIAVGLAQASQDSTSKLLKFVNEVDVSTTFGKDPKAEDMLAKLEEYGLSLNNVYDLQNITNYMSAVWGFTVPSTDLEYADELSYCKETIAKIPHGKASEYDYKELKDADGNVVFASIYYEQIEDAFNSYCEANGIENPTEQYRLGFYTAMNDAILSGTMELSPTLSKSLQETANDMTYDQYVAYCSNLRVEGKLPTYYAYQQALALAPVSEYKTEQTEVEGMIKASLKEVLGDDGANYYMSGVENYPAIKREINEKICEFNGDTSNKEFVSWMQTYKDNLVSAYSAEFNEKQYNKIVKEMTGYSSGETKSVSSIIGKDMSEVFYQYKLGNYDGIVDDSAVSSALVMLTSTESKPSYEDVRDVVYGALYPNGEGYDKASDEEKSNVMLTLEIATLTAEEQRRVETTFGDYFGSPAIPVAFEGGKQAYLLSSGNKECMVVWSESVYDNAYYVGLLRGERSIDDYDTSKGGNRTYLKLDDIGNAELFQRTASGSIDLSIRDDYEIVDEATGEAKEIDDSVVDSAYKWATTEKKYPKVWELMQYLSDNIENVDSIAEGWKKAVKKTGYLYQIASDPEGYIDALVTQAKAKSETVQTRKTYKAVGRDGNFQWVLQKIGHVGKGTM